MKKLSKQLYSIYELVYNIFDGRDMYRIYYTKNNYMIRHLTLAIFRLRNEKNLVSCLLSFFHFSTWRWPVSSAETCSCSLFNKFYTYLYHQKKSCVRYIHSNLVYLWTQRGWRTYDYNIYGTDLVYREVYKQTCSIFIFDTRVRLGNNTKYLLNKHICEDVEWIKQAKNNLPT